MLLSVLLISEQADYRAYAVSPAGERFAANEAPVVSGAANAAEKAAGFLSTSCKIRFLTELLARFLQMV
jgi:hypothetical protein